MFGVDEVDEFSPMRLHEDFPVLSVLHMQLVTMELTSRTSKLGDLNSPLGMDFLCFSLKRWPAAIRSVRCWEDQLRNGVAAESVRAFVAWGTGSESRLAGSNHAGNLLDRTSRPIEQSFPRCHSYKPCMAHDLRAEPLCLAVLPSDVHCLGSRSEIDDAARRCAYQLQATASVW